MDRTEVELWVAQARKFGKAPRNFAILKKEYFANAVSDIEIIEVLKAIAHCHQMVLQEDFREDCIFVWLCSDYTP